MPDYKSVIVSSNKNKKKKKKKKENAFAAIFKGLIPWKGDSIGEVIRKIVFLVSIVALCVAVLIIIDTYLFKPKRESADYQSSILQLGEHEPTAEEIKKLPEKAINTEYAPFYAINNDFVGWLSINGINVNYPVVQGKDNTHYLETDFYGNYSKNGTIFADYENEFKNTGETSANTILYGHNLRTENFFAEITEYRRVDLDKSLEFLKAHPVIEFNTLYEKAKYKIFSVMLLNTREEYGDVFNYPALLNFASRDEFNYFTSECLDRSEFFTGVDMKYGDKFLTLSTCEFEVGLYDMRIVIVARKVREGESDAFTADEIASFKRNPDPKLCKTMRELYYYDAEWSGRYWDPAWIEGFKKDSSFITDDSDKDTDNTTEAESTE